MNTAARSHRHREPDRRRPVTRQAALVAATVLALLALAGCGGSAAGGQHDAVLDVRGQGVTSATITYNRAGQQQTQESGVPLPWTQHFTIDSNTSQLEVIAQATGGSGSISCAISVDGKVIASSQSSGQFASAQCLGQP
ncbi:MAG: MmpS family transport accessory protein [Nocardioides sp.]